MCLNTQYAFGSTSFEVCHLNISMKTIDFPSLVSDIKYTVYKLNKYSNTGLYVKFMVLEKILIRDVIADYSEYRTSNPY